MEKISADELDTSQRYEKFKPGVHSFIVKLQVETKLFVQNNIVGCYQSFQISTGGQTTQKPANRTARVELSEHL